jgi:transposase
MPRALARAVRQEIVQRHLRGPALTQIAAELPLSYDTVRTLWRAFRDQGEDGLAIQY